MEVHLVVRHLIFQHGGQVTVPMNAFENPISAQRASEALDLALTGLMSAELCEVSGNQVRQSGMSLQEFLASLGLGAIEHSVMKVTTEDVPS